MTFFWPWMFLLLPLPVIIRWLTLHGYLRNSREDQPGALKLPGFKDLEALIISQRKSRFWHKELFLPWLIWILLVIAVAQPLWMSDKTSRPVSGRDLMLLIDTSGSMRQMDFTRLINNTRQKQAKDNLSSQRVSSMDYSSISRLGLVKILAADFVRQRHGDRIGLILFGERPYLRAGLTFDRAAVEQLIGETEIALAGESTAIGDAIGLAIKRMQNLPANNRVIVLLTDGGNNEGMVSPVKAAEVAAQTGIRIYTIGIGKATNPGPNPFGIWSAENAQRFDESVLKAVAKISEGQYFHALDSYGLSEAYQRLNELEPALHPESKKHLAYALYPWPLGLALLLSVWGMISNRLPQLEVLVHD